MSKADKESRDKASQLLTEAIANYLRVFELDGSAPDDGDPRVLTDYLVLTATQGWTKTGDGVTGHPYIFREGMPLYRALGLMQVSIELLASALHDEDE